MGFNDARKIANSGKREESTQRVMKPLWAYNQHGQSGRWGSELFPEMARHADDLTFIHSMHTEGIAHGPATLFLHCGATQFIRPSMGSWISYGLGAENENLPAFVAIPDPRGVPQIGPRHWGSAFLPAVFQGTPFNAQKLLAAAGADGVPMYSTFIRLFRFTTSAVMAICCVRLKLIDASSEA